MAVTISVGLQKKVGLPDFGSLGASCSIDFEIDRTLIEHDLQGFHDKVRGAFAACQQSVQDQLARQQAEHPSAAPNGHNGNGHATNGYSNGNGNGRGNGRSGNSRPATASQARAIRAIAGKHRVDLVQLLGDRFQVARPEDLSITDASHLIDELKSPAENTGGTR